ncbi:unnamed protein product [Notodromas monacha]|uniref:Uncharacterized protein n=1 Tax=Notodromas monacha TaxID=399045 RepID=A0A7R9BCY2_9CRUS|nr:unnamed protein product [Notodromas monacha]CAG0913051.1 unnamed protein product [Notodromas monacha]
MDMMEQMNQLITRFTAMWQTGFLSASGSLGCKLCMVCLSEDAALGSRYAGRLHYTLIHFESHLRPVDDEVMKLVEDNDRKDCKQNVGGLGHAKESNRALSLQDIGQSGSGGGGGGMGFGQGGQGFGFGAFGSGFFLQSTPPMPLMLEPTGEALSSVGKSTGDHLQNALSILEELGQGQGTLMKESELQNLGYVSPGSNSSIRLSGDEDCQLSFKVSSSWNPTKELKTLEDIIAKIKVPGPETKFCKVQDFNEINTDEEKSVQESSENDSKATFTLRNPEEILEGAPVVTISYESLGKSHFEDLEESEERLTLARGNQAVSRFGLHTATLSALWLDVDPRSPISHSEMPQSSCQTLTLNLMRTLHTACPARVYMLPKRDWVQGQQHRGPLECSRGVLIMRIEKVAQENERLKQAAAEKELLEEQNRNLLLRQQHFLNLIQQQEKVIFHKLHTNQGPGEASAAPASPHVVPDPDDHEIPAKEASVVSGSDQKLCQDEECKISTVGLCLTEEKPNVLFTPKTLDPSEDDVKVVYKKFSCWNSTVSSAQMSVENFSQHDLTPAEPEPVSTVAQLSCDQFSNETPPSGKKTAFVELLPITHLESISELDHGTQALQPLDEPTDEKHHSPIPEILSESRKNCNGSNDFECDIYQEKPMSTLATSFTSAQNVPSELKFDRGDNFSTTKLLNSQNVASVIIIARNINRIKRRRSNKAGSNSADGRTKAGACSELKASSE